MMVAEFESVSRALIALLRDNSMKLAFAESCTGGLASAAITDIGGASDVFERGFVTYSNESKIESLGVDAALVDTYGAVSGEVAAAMALGAVVNSRADVAASITGIAGPSGANDQKPVGLVWFGLCFTGQTPICVAHEFGDLGRRGIRARAVFTVIDLVSCGVAARNKG